MEAQRLCRLNLEEEKTIQTFRSKSASELNLCEKDLENWMKKNPKLLFGDEGVLVISQSVSGKSMADILALDGEGGADFLDA